MYSSYKNQLNIFLFNAPFIYPLKTKGILVFSGVINNRNIDQERVKIL